MAEKTPLIEIKQALSENEASDYSSILRRTASILRHLDNSATKMFIRLHLAPDRPARSPDWTNYYPACVYMGY